MRQEPPQSAPPLIQEEAGLDSCANDEGSTAQDPIDCNHEEHTASALPNSSPVDGPSKSMPTEPDETVVSTLQKLVEALSEDKGMIEVNDAERTASSMSLSSLVHFPSKLQSADKDATPASALQELTEAVANQADEQKLSAQAVIPTEPAESPKLIISVPEVVEVIPMNGETLPFFDASALLLHTANADAVAPNHSDLAEDSRAHWLARAMSSEAAAAQPADPVEPYMVSTESSFSHWMGRAMAAANSHVNSAAASLDQWMRDPAWGSCMPLRPVPVVPDLPHAATGQRTVVEPNSFYSSELPPPIPQTHMALSALVPSPVSAPRSQPQGMLEGGAIGDATAELLRPLLRQWLNENMGVMMEKALAAEVASATRS
jgi:cell pole-organizing protein PopZ